MVSPSGRVGAVLLAIAGCVGWAAPARAVEPPRLKVLVSVDLEGIGGVATSEVQASPKGREFEQFRRLMTLEANAAVSGAFDAGATEVVVADAHGDGQNLDVELLDRRARLVRAWPRPLAMIQGLDESFGAVVLVGYHAAEGTAGAGLAHTMWGATIAEIRLNGVAVPEAAFNAGIAAELGVPVVFVSGDQVACRQARELLGPIETAAVKDATGYFSALMRHPEEAQRLVRRGVKRGVERRGELKPWRVAHPVRLEVSFKKQILAEKAAYMPGMERPSGSTVAYPAKDMLEASRVLEVLLNLSPE